MMRAHVLGAGMERGMDADIGEHAREEFGRRIDDFTTAPCTARLPRSSPSSPGAKAADRRSRPPCTHRRSPPPRRTAACPPALLGAAVDGPRIRALGCRRDACLTH